MSVTFFADLAAATAALEERGPLAVPVGIPLGEPMATRSASFYKSDDGRIFIGLWEVEPGRMRADFDEGGEFFHVVAGRMTIMPDEGEPFELKAGDTANFPPYWKGIWDIQETMRKMYCVY